MINVTSTKAWKLIYQGSQDEFEINKFHLKVDGVLGTLVVIKTGNGDILGGYTNADWREDYSNYYKYDDKTFIFSLKNPFGISFKSSPKDNAFAIRSSLNTLGFGNDFSFFSYKYLSGFSSLGQDFNNPYYFEYILTDSKEFQINEIEVYSSA